MLHGCRSAAGQLLVVATGWGCVAQDEAAPSELQGLQTVYAPTYSATLDLVCSSQLYANMIPAGPLSQTDAVSMPAADLSMHNFAYCIG